MVSNVTGRFISDRSFSDGRLVPPIVVARPSGPVNAGPDLFISDSDYYPLPGRGVDRVILRAARLQRLLLCLFDRFESSRDPDRSAIYRVHARYSSLVSGLEYVNAA